MSAVERTSADRECSKRISVLEQVRGRTGFFCNFHRPCTIISIIDIVVVVREMKFVVTARSLRFTTHFFVVTVTVLSTTAVAVSGAFFFGSPCTEVVVAFDIAYMERRRERERRAKNRINIELQPVLFIIRCSLLVVAR